MKTNSRRWLRPDPSDAPVQTEGERGREGEGEHAIVSGSPTLPLPPSLFPLPPSLFSRIAAHERQLRCLVILLGAVVFIVQWVRAATHLEDGDFYLHWEFARRFVHHGLLYAEGLHIPYPPFWAMAWSPIAAFSLAAAKILCYPLSVAALAWLLWILHRLTRDQLPLSARQRFWATAAALAIVSRFLVRELPECGPNLLLLALSWSAIYLWTRHRDIAAGTCLGFATALKCTPALFIAYFAWKRQWKLAATSIVAAAAFALAPALWQGPTDYQRHVRLWLTHLSLGAGQTDPTIGVLGPETLQNLSLRPALARWLMRLPPGHPSRLDNSAYVEFLDLAPTTAGRITKLALLALLAAVAWAVRKPVSRRDDLTILWECAAIGALALLLSPITWYQHCVALLPVFYLFTRTAVYGERPANWMLAVVGFFVLSVIVLSRGLIGREATMLLASYHLTTWAILGVLILALGCGRLLSVGNALRGVPRARASRQPALRGTPQRAFPTEDIITPTKSTASAPLSPTLPLSHSLTLRKSLSWTTLFMALGLVLRVYHYLRNPSLWHDEAALVVNVLEKGFVELLGPLRFSEAAPPLFLWLEKGASVALGESLFALRLMPLLASCAALVLFVPVARRLLSPAAATWAVLLFAFSDRLLWHACEAKQYSIEVLVSVLLMAIWLVTNGWPRWRRAVIFTLLAPPLLWVAYPAAFVYGGLLVAVLLDMWRSRRPADWLAYGFLCLTVLATFWLLLAGPIHAQRDETIVTCWDAMSQFPDWSHPASVPGWVLGSTCDLVGYCVKPLGQWLAPLAAGGLVLFWRQGKRDWCLLLAAPILLALVASCIKTYPYGGMRVMIYAAPAVCLLVAAAVPLCLDRLTRRHVWAAVPLIALLTLPVVRAGYFAVRPWQRADCAAAAAYVKQQRTRDELVTANHWEYLYYFRRLGGDFVPIETLGMPAQDRLWVVVTGATPADRQPCITPFTAPDWTIQDRREFERTTVLHVERSPVASRSSDPVARRP